MEAVQFNPATKKLSLIKAQVPTVGNPNQVVVQVAYSGICGTDVHITEGTFPCNSVPVILGHEFSGVVTSVGSAVTHVKPGDRAVVDPNNGCNKCRYCTKGAYHFCAEGGISNTVGIFLNGGWAEYCVVPSTQVYRLPDNIPLDHGALCEPLSCISHGWDRLGPVSHSSKIIVLGAGIIGNLWVSLFHLQGYKNVIVSEPQEGRRKLLEKLDTGYEIVAPVELKKRSAADPSWGVDVVVDCSGCAPAMEEALNWLNPGGRMCMFGVAAPQARVSVSPYEIYKRELTIIGVVINPFSFNNALGLLEALGERYLNYSNLGVKTFNLKQHDEALESLKKGSIAKAVFKIGSN